MTFVRIGQFRAKRELVGELRDTYERDAIPAIRAAAGNISAALLQQHDADDEFLAITVWSTRADAEAYDASGQAAAMVAKIKHAFAGPPTLRTYDAYGIAPRA
jgi:quinol monooxygenase YgiN